MAELVDAPDSKSGGAKASCRFEPDLRYFCISCKVTKIRFRKEKPRRSRRGFLLQPYCNASAEGFFEGAGGAVLHVGEHVRVGVEGDSDIGVI